MCHLVEQSMQLGSDVGRRERPHTRIAHKVISGAARFQGGVNQQTQAAPCHQARQHHGLDALADEKRWD